MTPADRLTSARSQLKAVKALNDGWDTMGGKAPTRAALDITNSLVETSRVPPSRVAGVPRSEGAVDLKWNGSVTAYVYPDGRTQIDLSRTTSSVSVAVSLVDAATREEPRPTAGVRAG